MEDDGVVGYLSESYSAVAASVGCARSDVAEVAAAAGLRGEELDRVRLVVSEAVTNSIRHAYPDEEGTIHVMSAVADGELWVLVVDEGRGLEATSPNPGLGLGLKIMERMSDGFMLAERAVGGLEARLQFALPVTCAGRRGGHDRGSVASATSPA
jgi:stage II sporulation protein AB (anti-sigma F factor)